jgi:hypothetical protein
LPLGNWSVTFSLAGYISGRVSGVSVVDGGNSVADEQLELEPNP